MTGSKSSDVTDETRPFVSSHLLVQRHIQSTRTMVPPVGDIRHHAQDTWSGIGLLVPVRVVSSESKASMTDGFVMENYLF